LQYTVQLATQFYKCGCGETENL